MAQSHGDAIYGIVAAVIEQGARFATTADLVAEIAARKAGDTAEASTRSAADETTNAALAAEVTARGVAISTHTHSRLINGTGIAILDTDGVLSSSGDIGAFNPNNV